MANKKWLMHFIGSSMAVRAGRIGVAVLSVSIAAAVVVAAFGISSGIRRKLGAELKSYGANIMVSPKDGYLNERILRDLERKPGIENYSGQLYAMVSVNGHNFEMIGMDFSGAESWKVAGALPEKGEVLLGVDIKDSLGLKAGDYARLSHRGPEERVRVSGFVERGSAEDRAVMLSLSEAQRIAGLGGNLSAVLIRSNPELINETVRTVEDLAPNAEVKTVKQVAEAEESFLQKVELLLILVSIVVVGASSISVSSTMSATVLERTKEIALMKALGGASHGIRAFFLLEAAVIGALGGLAGFLAGLGASEAVSKAAFGSFIWVPPSLLPFSVGIGLAIALLASALPMRPALKQKPSAVLRGE